MGKPVWAFTLCQSILGKDVGPSLSNVKLIVFNGVTFCILFRFCLWNNFCSLRRWDRPRHITCFWRVYFFWVQSKIDWFFFLHQEFVQIGPDLLREVHYFTSHVGDVNIFTSTRHRIYIQTITKSAEVVIFLIIQVLLRRKHSIYGRLSLVRVSIEELVQFLNTTGVSTIRIVWCLYCSL